MSINHPPHDEHIDHDMYKIEVNLDDISSELLGYMIDLLFEAGANDVYYTPIYMKKNRPAILLQLLCSKQHLNQMKKILFQETTTLGIRYYPLTVHRAKREFRKISTKWGPVTIKTGMIEGEVIQRSPEYADCEEIAKRHHLPLKKVYEHVWQKIIEQTES